MTVGSREKAEPEDIVYDTLKWLEDAECRVEHEASIPTGDCAIRVERVGDGVGAPGLGERVEVWRDTEFLGIGRLVGWLRRKPTYFDGVACFEIGENYCEARAEDNVALPVVETIDMAWPTVETTEADGGVSRYLPEYPTCPDCGGVVEWAEEARRVSGECYGKACPECDETGTLEETDCWECNGSGMAGELDCPACEIRAFAEPDCPVCDGAGVVGELECLACPACEARALPELGCPVCGGAGVVGEECSECDGSGMVGGECSACDGSGREGCGSTFYEYPVSRADWNRE